MTKDAIRRQIWDMLAAGRSPVDPYGRIPLFEGQNRAAERLRRWPLYRGAQCLMVAPDEALLQVRANALRDWKRLVVATPGLDDGFYLLDAREIPPGHWMRAVRASGVREHGRRLITSREGLGSIDLLITGAVAVDEHGGRIGKGRGYFDLEYAILRQIGCAGEETPIVGILHESQILAQVPVSASTLTHHLKKLVAGGVLVRDPDQRYRVSDGKDVARLMVSYDLATAGQVDTFVRVWGEFRL